MGNFWIPQFDSSSSSSPSSTGPSSPGITNSTSNEGMHSGTWSVFSSRLEEELKRATRNFRLDTVVGAGLFGKVFKARSRMAAATKARSRMAAPTKARSRMAPTKAGSRMAAPTKAGSRMASVVMKVMAVQRWHRNYCQMKMGKLQYGCPS